MKPMTVPPAEAAKQYGAFFFRKSPRLVRESRAVTEMPLSFQSASIES